MLKDGQGSDWAGTAEYMKEETTCATYQRATMSVLLIDPNFFPKSSIQGFIQDRSENLVVRLRWGLGLCLIVL